MNKRPITRRRLILIGLLLLSLSALQAQFEGTPGAGVHLGYASAAKRPGAGVHLHYYPTNNLRFAPSFTRYLEAGSMQMWMAETDLHYILPLNPAASLYPIVGLQYSNWNDDNWIDPSRLYDPAEGGMPMGESHTSHRIGTSLGIGYQHDIRYRVRANLEFKYQFIKDYSQMFFMAGFGFWL